MAVLGRMRLSPARKPRRGEFEAKLGLDGIQCFRGALDLRVKVASDAQELNPIGHGFVSRLAPTPRDVKRRRAAVARYGQGVAKYSPSASKLPPAGTVFEP